MFIPDPTFFHPGSRILIKEFKYFNPKKAKKWFLSSKKYDPGCSSRILDPNAYFRPSRIPDQGVKKAPNPGSGSATLVADPGSGAFLTPGCGIRDEHPGSYIRELRIKIFG
jgi:hypothetical protein